ncbi:MAG TPA: multicopper oxidase domain-containing protein [Rugosimonospora sp.]|nr:multicopper oxidase domain-containing protein [Rugosimonospora sp.]
MTSRRDLLGTAAMTAVGLAAGTVLNGPSASAQGRPVPYTPSTEHDQPTVPGLGVLAYKSPTLEPYVDPLPLLPVRPLGGRIVLAEAQHSFHRDLPPAPSWGYGGQTHLGPVLEAMSGQSVVTTFVNNLRQHIIGNYLDTSLHGASPQDLTHPPAVIHLHGAPNRPEADGFPMSPFRPGQSVDYRFGNNLAATTLWYHDHSMGETRLNLYAGLAAPYYVRDQWDTGKPDNPLGLPTGDHEIPLIICDKVFYPNGSLRYSPIVTEIAQGMWGGGMIGDVLVVNGKAWPYLNVDRGLYRFRVINASQLEDYRLSLSNGMPFWVIGSDGGLLDAPVLVAAVDIAPAERYDLLIDFSTLPPGTSVDLRNSMQITLVGQVAGSQRIPNVMRFNVGDGPGNGLTVPTRLRGSATRTPPPLPPVAQPTLPPVPHTLAINTNPQGRLIAMLCMNIDNLLFDSPDVDMPVQGTTQQWSLVNADLTNQVHSIHIHLVQFRVLGRQNYDQVRYLASKPPPALGTRWAPAPQPYITGPVQPPAPYEAGWKDTVRCPPGQITHLVVRWPTAHDLGFDPDAPFLAPDGTTQQGYVWHCHLLEHEDNEMMRRLRVVAAGSTTGS